MTTPTELLTDIEKQALRITANLAGACRTVVGDGPNAAADWNELAVLIHGIQHAILAQAAARRYPYEYRLLGEHIPDEPPF